MGFDLTGLGSVADLASGLVNRFFPPSMSEQEKAAAEIEIGKVLERRETAVLDTQSKVMTAELEQGDKFTKRARPSVVYFGLLFIGLVHVLFPIVAWLVLTIKGSSIEMPELALPGEFWMTWGGICSVWVIGRSAEKRGASNKLISMITGSK